MMCGGVHVFQTSALVGGEWSASRPGRFTPVERAPSTQWIRGWLGPRTGLHAADKRKFWPYQDSNSDPLVIQLVASHYTNYIVQASLCQICINESFTHHWFMFQNVSLSQWKQFSGEGMLSVQWIPVNWDTSGLEYFAPIMRLLQICEFARKGLKSYTVCT
jgi:hypothetical protein